MDPPGYWQADASCAVDQRRMSSPNAGHLPWAQYHFGMCGEFDRVTSSPSPSLQPYAVPSVGGVSARDRDATRPSGHVQLLARQRVVEAPLQPKSAPLPGALLAALGGERAKPTKKELLTSFCMHQIEVCQKFDVYLKFYHAMKSADIVDSSELEALDSMYAIIQMHKELLQRLQRDSDMAAADPLGSKPQFCSIVHDTFFELRNPFRIYMETFDKMFEILTNWKANNAAFSQMLTKSEGAGSSATKFNFAAFLALPLTCLHTHQETLQQYRLSLQKQESDLETAYVDETLCVIRSMRQRAAVCGATDQAVNALLSIEKKMVRLASCDIAGAVVSIVKLGRKIVHIGRLQMLSDMGAGSGGHRGEREGELTGYLFSDMLVCCDGYNGELVARFIVDLKAAEVEPYEGRTQLEADGRQTPLHAFGIHQTDRKGADRLEARCTDFCTTDAGSCHIWVSKLTESLSTLAGNEICPNVAFMNIICIEGTISTYNFCRPHQEAFGLRIPCLSVEELKRLRHVSKGLIDEITLFGSASDTAEDSGRCCTSASDSEWDVEGAVYFDDTLYEDEEEKEESGVLAGLRKCSEIARLKGLTADEPEFRRVLLQKLQLVSLKLRSCEIVASDRRGSWHGSESPPESWDPSDAEDDENESFVPFRC